MVTYFYPKNNKKIQPTREPQRTAPKETTRIICHLNRHTWIKKFRTIVKNKKQCHRILLHSNYHFKSYTLEWYSDSSSRSTERVWNNEMIVMDQIIKPHYRTSKHDCSWENGRLLLLDQLGHLVMRSTGTTWSQFSQSLSTPMWSSSDIPKDCSNVVSAASSPMVVSSSSGRYRLLIASLIWLLAPFGSRSIAQEKFICARWFCPSFL